MAEDVEMEATPSSETEEPWLWEYRQENIEKNVYPPSESGKWMMFYTKGYHLDDAWARAKELYRSGQLPNIHGMKVSTALPDDPLAKPQKTGVLIFYCGPASDKNKMLAIGGDVVEKMQYRSSHISYKTDEQTRQGIKGHTYMITLGENPRRHDEPKSRSDCPVWPRGCKP